VISLRKLKFSRQVHAFKEHRALMGAAILNSPRAVAMSVYVICAFLNLRSLFDILHPALYFLPFPTSHPPPPKPQIGTQVKEDAVPYRTREGAPQPGSTISRSTPR
jgi:hypothetical protein